MKKIKTFTLNVHFEAASLKAAVRFQRDVANFANEHKDVRDFLTFLKPIEDDEPEAKTPKKGS